jgi:hypothetical protein
MSTFYRYGLAVLACIIVLAIFQFAPAQGDAAKAVQKWEYRVLVIETNTTKAKVDLSAYGEEGWELVCVTADKGEQPVVYLKRPK